MLAAIFNALAFDLRSSALAFLFDDDVFASFQVRLQSVGSAPFCSHREAMKAP
jgi:hypothetical protein